MVYLYDLVQHYWKRFPLQKGADYLFANQRVFGGIKHTNFRSFYYTIFFFHEGTGSFTVGSNDYKIKPGNLVAIGPGVSFHWTPSRHLVYDVIIFNENIFKPAFNTNAFFYSLDYFCPDVHSLIELEDEAHSRMIQLFKTISAFEKTPAALPGLLHALLLFIQEQYWKQYQNKKRKLSQKETIVANFRALVATHFKTHKDVSFYGKKLNISAKYLSETLLKETGISAKKWIEHHLSVEAKALLSYSNTAIKEISYRLGFEDTSHFTKAFKKWEGTTPALFRKKTFTAKSTKSADFLTTVKM